MYRNKGKTPNNSVENYYEDGEGEKHKLTDEIIDRQIYDGTSKKKETKPLLRIVEWIKK